MLTKSGATRKENIEKIFGRDLANELMPLKVVRCAKPALAPAPGEQEKENDSGGNGNESDGEGSGDGYDDSVAFVAEGFVSKPNYA